MKTAGTHQNRNGNRAQRESRGAASAAFAVAGGALDQPPRKAGGRHAGGEQAVDLKQEALNMLELAGSQSGAPALLIHSSWTVEVILRQF